MFEAAQSHSMGCMRVVEAGIAGLDAVQVAIEGGYFDADFGDEIPGEMYREGGWVVRGGPLEEESVELVGYWHLAAHFGLPLLLSLWPGELTLVEEERWRSADREMIVIVH